MLELRLGGVGLEHEVWPVRSRSALIVVPFTDLAPETKAALECDRLRPRYVDVSDDDWAYWRLLDGLWRDGATFVIVEHDIVPWPGAVRAMLDCQSDWCAYPYLMGSIEGTAFGCTKFGAGVIARQPTAVSRILPQHRGWNALDSMVTATLRRNGEPEHIHQPPVRHLRFDTGGVPMPRPAKRRNRVATRLLYVGRGRYLNGVPTSDFETDDPMIVAQALESGLYLLASDLQAPAPALEPVTVSEPVEPQPDVTLDSIPPVAEEEDAVPSA